MIPVYQDRFGKPLGNCFAACIASIFELPLRNVPDFAKINLNEDGTDNGDWYAAAWDFCVARGFELHYRYSKSREDGTSGIDWIEGAYPYHLIGGTSPRGLSHSVVGYKGKIIHDPHPEGGGLSPVSDFGFLVPIGLVARPDKSP